MCDAVDAIRCRHVPDFGPGIGVEREDSDCFAQCLDYDVSSFGATKEEALAMLKEGVGLYSDDEAATESFP